jgi:ABC-type lipoprotein release transport system permease subunit
MLSRVLRGMLFGVSAFDPLSYVALTLVLAAVALFASWLPARRASRVDPGVALRAE